MTTNQELSDEQKGIELSEIANEEWPIIKEISTKRFNINKRSDVKTVAQNTENVPTLNVETIVAEEQVEEMANAEETANPQPELVAPILPAQSVLAKEVKKESVINKEESSEDFDVKSFSRGLFHLFVNSSSNLLKPLSFLLENGKSIVYGLLHLSIPAIMAWYMTHQVSFIAMQLAKEPVGMQVIYTLVFYLAATFVWVLSQVVIFGIFSIFKTASKEIAKVGKSSVN